MKRSLIATTLTLAMLALPAAAFAGEGKKKCTEAEKLACKLKKEQKQQAKNTEVKKTAKPKKTA